MTELSKQISNLDLESVLARLRRDENLPVQEIEQAVKEYKQFLELRLQNVDAAVVPSVLADKVWHHHILDTRKYTADCENIFGEFLHHNPNAENLDAHAAQTQKKWQQTFKEDAPAAYQSAFCQA